jgi:pSer/pThr/pTyr-binding forkhead associated (FHA) protein
MRITESLVQGARDVAENKILNQGIHGPMEPHPQYFKDGFPDSLSQRWNFYWRVGRPGDRDAAWIFPKKEVNSRID